VPAVAYVEVALGVEAEPESEAAGRGDLLHRALERDAVDLPGLAAGIEAPIRAPSDALRMIEVVDEDTDTREVNKRLGHGRPLLVSRQGSR
jgi:hypothetical protein